MAQNEMKAKPALPERVRSMEGLGVWLVERQLDSTNGRDECRSTKAFGWCGAARQLRGAWTLCSTAVNWELLTFAAAYEVAPRLQENPACRDRCSTRPNAPKSQRYQNRNFSVFGARCNAKACDETNCAKRDDNGCDPASLRRQMVFGFAHKTPNV